MSAPTAVDQGALLAGLARPRIVAPRRTSENGPVTSYDGPERRSIDPLAALSREHDQLCVEATDPWEIAAGLEAAGVDDRRARREYGVASVFDLAVELFLNVPRRPPAEPDPADPWHRPLRHHLLRGRGRTPCRRSRTSPRCRCSGRARNSRRCSCPASSPRAPRRCSPSSTTCSSGVASARRRGAS